MTQDRSVETTTETFLPSNTNHIHRIKPCNNIFRCVWVQCRYSLSCHHPLFECVSNCWMPGKILQSLLGVHFLWALAIPYLGRLHSILHNEVKGQPYAIAVRLKKLFVHAMKTPSRWSYDGTNIFFRKRSFATSIKSERKKSANNYYIGTTVDHFTSFCAWDN